METSRGGRARGTGKSLAVTFRMWDVVASLRLVAYKKRRGRPSYTFPLRRFPSAVPIVTGRHRAVCRFVFPHLIIVTRLKSRGNGGGGSRSSTLPHSLITARYISFFSRSSRSSLAIKGSPGSFDDCLNIYRLSSYLIKTKLQEHHEGG